MNGLPRVLLIEDEEDFHELFEKLLEGEVEFLDAYTITEAERIFESVPGISIVVVDACVPGSFPTTEPLVRKIRARFSGPMIAISSDPEYRKVLIAAGCDFQCEKWCLQDVLRRMLAGM